jgi:hypothetical protein
MSLQSITPSAIAAMPRISLAATPAVSDGAAQNNIPQPNAGASGHSDWQVVIDPATLAVIFRLVDTQQLVQQIPDDVLLLGNRAFLKTSQNTPAGLAARVDVKH